MIDEEPIRYALVRCEDCEGQGVLGTAGCSPSGRDYIRCPYCNGGRVEVEIEEIVE